MQLIIYLLGEIIVNRKLFIPTRYRDLWKDLKTFVSDTTRTAEKVEESGSVKKTGHFCFALSRMIQEH